MSSKFIVYKTTNLVNKKIYIGCHVTNNLQDIYLGSGKILIQAIAKYGIENFSKEVLYVYDNPIEMFQKETELVDSQFVANENTYNLKIGGEGGWDYILHNKSNWNEERYKAHCIEMKKRRALGLWGQNPASYGMKGKHHRLDTKLKLSQNNGNLLPQDVLQKRFKDLKQIDINKWGAITKLAKQWCISHTSVKRFLLKHNLLLA